MKNLAPLQKCDIFMEIPVTLVTLNKFFTARIVLRCDLNSISISSCWTKVKYAKL